MDLPALTSIYTASGSVCRAVIARYGRGWHWWLTAHRLLVTMGTTGMISMVGGVVLVWVG